MKKTLAQIFLVLAALVGAFPAFAVNLGDPYKYVYAVIDSDRSPVMGLNPEIKIQRASDGAWLDFSDTTFKPSEWVSIDQALYEDIAGGFYHYTFTPPESETTPNQYVFIVNVDSSLYPDHQPFTVSYEDNALNKYVNGLKDNGEYEGIEKMIRVQR